MDDGERRCALPGCGRTITTTAGRPERRYCTAAHRAAARRARRAAVPAEQPDGPDVLADALPWVRDALGTGAARAGDVDDPDAEPVRPRRPAETTPASAMPSDSRARRPAPRRRHALALLGVAGILAGGYAVTDAQPEPAPAQAAPEGPAAPDEAAADTWAQHATVALASVNRQLDTLAQTEEEWRRLPESERAAVPAPVVALEERRSVLQRRRATLQAQLDDYRSLRRTQQELASSEQHLRAVETALADAPPRRHRSAEQEAAIAALEEQRDLRIRRRDVQRTELATLQDGVSTATRTPLPDDAAATATITADVIEVVRNGGTEPGRHDSQPARPDVVAGREPEDGKPRQEVGTSGPPDPRGPRDESDERRAAKERRAAQAANARTRPAEPTAAPSHREPDDSARRRDTSDKDTAESRARYRRTGMREPAARKPASTDVAERGSQYRHTDRSASTDRESADKDSADRDTAARASTAHDSKDRAVTARRSTHGDAEERDRDERGSRQHGEMTKRTDHKSKPRDSTGRKKDRDCARHESHHRDSADRSSTGHCATDHGSTTRESDADDRHRPATSGSDRADESTHRGDDGPHRAATSADR